MSGRQTNDMPDFGESTHDQCDAIREQLDAYVLGALDRFDAGVVEQHLRWCPRCRVEAEAITRVVALLPLAVPSVDPPALHVKARLMTRVATDLQSDPYEPAFALPADREQVRATPTVAVPRISENGKNGARALGTRSWTRFAPAAVIAPLAILLIVVGAWANSMRNDLHNRRELAFSGQQELNQIVANGGQVQLYSMEPQCSDCTGRGRLGVDVSDNVGVVVAWNLNADQKHEVWCVSKRGDKEMVTTLDVDADGGAMQAFTFPEAMADYSEVYIAQTDGSATYMTHLVPTPAAIETPTP